MVEVVPPLAAVVGYLVDLADDLTKLRPRRQVVFAIDENLPLHLLPDLHRSEALLRLYGPSYEGTRLHLYSHQLQDVQPLEGAPTGIEFLQILPDFGHACLEDGTRPLLRDLPVEITKRMLQFEKLDHEPTAVVEHLLREGVLLPVDPEIGEALIG